MLSRSQVLSQPINFYFHYNFVISALTLTLTLTLTLILILSKIRPLKELITFTQYYFHFVAMDNTISLQQLSETDHPLLLQGDFSIYHDPLVSPTKSLNYTVDVDGLVLLSNHLEAFRLGLVGEERIYTTHPVTTFGQFFSKTDFVDLSAFHPEMRKHTEYIPGFKFADMPGAPLNVVGFLKPTTTLNQLEDVNLSDFATFYKKILNKSIDRLPLTTRTRCNNMTMSYKETHTLPTYYRLYPEDIPALSTNICRALRSLDDSYPFQYYFAYHKFGQQQLLQIPVTIQSILTHILADQSLIIHASFHLALTFRYRNDSFSVFWRPDPTSQFFHGKITKFPVFGLYEIANITSRKPTGLNHIFPPPHRDNVEVTYAQAYTPSVKSLGRDRPFVDHPFLLCYILGKEYVQHSRHLEKLRHSVINELDCYELLEMVTLNLFQAKARLEVVITSNEVNPILSFQAGTLFNDVKLKNLLVKIPNLHVGRYATNLVQELMEPLRSIIQNPTHGRGIVATLIFCETLLSLLPSMSVKDMPYKLLKGYNIMPLHSGLMATHKRLNMTPYAGLSQGMFHIEAPQLERIFLPLQDYSSAARRIILPMIRFVNLMKTSDRTELAEKAATILVEAFEKELKDNGTIIVPAELRKMDKLVGAGHILVGCVDVGSYTAKVFDPEMLPTTSSMRQFLQVAVNLTSKTLLQQALTKHLPEKLKYVPRVTTHSNRISFTSQFYVLSPVSDAVLRARARTRPLRKLECLPILEAASSQLINNIQLSQRVSEKITTYSARKGEIISAIIRKHIHSSMKTIVGVTTLALVFLAKEQGLLPKVTTRQYQRDLHLNRVTSTGQIRKLVRSTTLYPTRPFSINITRLRL